MSDPRGAPPVLARYRALARAMDTRFGIPGTPIRFGWDALLGLVPGIGDALGGLLGGYGLYAAWRLGAPAVVLARMLVNLTVDVLGGELPLLGDLFDVAWRGNQRNLALLERWLAEPGRVARRSAGVFLGAAAALGLVIVVPVLLLAWLLGRLAGG